LTFALMGCWPCVVAMNVVTEKSLLYRPQGEVPRAPSGNGMEARALGVTLTLVAGFNFEL